ncbi:helix-turn-helix transcriptional regulator [Lactobacillus sp.]|uniref:helix-turn-helix domain-containing protein n=1 Tax=Lactobacillus sp. TaxID=1591 RepID=UPI0025D7EF43|nr:helix-turn-helix transcriptional regulator [Lactobacillus sp.]MCO6530973.1 helix-turn-helix transcriptional regulator [Lactobacillus sp.]MCO6534578.1 helix-turn-helix transcriptional regulator [Lactobacillus sp.]
MRYIGSKLKQLRHDLGLTQTEMAAGVISVSFYSKVERGYHDIGAEELIEILQKHNISFQEFFSGISKEEADKKKLNALVNRFVRAANDDNDNEIVGIINEFESVKPRTPFIKSQILLAKMIANTHDKTSLEKLGSKEKKKIKKIIFQEDTDENEYLRIAIIANTIRVYSLDEASFLVSSIIRRYHDIDKVERKLLSALGALMANYVNWCFENGKSDLCAEALGYLKRLPCSVDFLIFKILVEYYESLVRHENNKTEEIRDILIKAGYKSVVSKMAKAI